MRTIFYLIFSTILCSEFIQGGEISSSEATKDQKLAVFLIEGELTEGKSRGTGFACSFKGQEFVATNLHVVEGAATISIKPQSGDPIRLSGKMIVAEDADVCLLGITGSFGEVGITPLEFMEDVFTGSKSGDKILCLGNSLGSGVISTTTGTIKAYGQPRLEIVSPVVGGNSGGPIIHMETGKVVGLVTEAIINDTKLDKLAAAASKSKDSKIGKISYFGHRVDSVKKWKGTNLQDYQKTSVVISKAETGLSRAVQFICNEDGWQDDRRLSEAWKTYQEFLDSASAKTTKRVEVTTYVNEYGVAIRRDTRVKGLSVAQSDYDRAREAFCRAVEWKILADQKILTQAKPLGYRQTERARMLLSCSDIVLTLQKDL
jgi:hypothetical protein